MTDVQVDVLGPLRVRADDREIDLGGPRSRALIARLALDAGRPVSAASLIDDLWGLDVPADATNALQSIVSRTRRRLPEGTLESTSAGYVLHGATVDAVEFERLVMAGRPADALGLWRGEVFADVRDAPFAAPAAARLTDLRLAALETHLGQVVESRPDPAVVAELAELTAAHPLREGLCLLYLKALAGTGRPAEALSAYESMRRTLADGLGADPSAELQEFHLTLLRGESVRRRRPAAGLPVGITSFVGRDEAITELGAALADHRLVTILGPGGSGKTRLAIETARACADRYDDIWLVELASVTGGDDIRSAILAAMGLLEVSVMERATPVTERPDARSKLFESVQDSRGMLILDNCEHLIDDVATTAEELLAHAAHLKILATSREPLRILGEFGYQLSPLRQPPAEVTVEQALTFSAIELFTQRATAVDQTFTLDAGTLGSVREICVRLDGQPLAIELAAARLRTLTVAQTAARLSDRFRLLTGGSRTALPRHRTLRAVVEWSWDLLSAEERRLAERIAVFPGGVTVESADAVADGGDVADLLDSLAEKSLLVPVRGDQPRFRMLETLREYGTERLVDQGTVQGVRGAHLDYFVDYAERWEPLLRGERQLEAFEALDAERGNITAALRFAVDQQDHPRALRLVAALAWYWSTRSQHEEAATWGLAVADLPGEGEPVAEIICSALALTAMFFTVGDESRIAAVTDRILDLHDAHGVHHPLADLIVSAIHLFGKGGNHRPPDPDDVWTRAAINLITNVVMENAGKIEEAIPGLDDAIKGFSEVGDRWGLATAMVQRGNIEAAGGMFEAARETWEQAIGLLKELGSDDDVFQAQIRVLALRIMAAEDDDIEPLREQFLARLDESRRQGDVRAEMLSTMGIAQLERTAGNHRLAIEHLQGVLKTQEFSGTFPSGHMHATMNAGVAVSQADLGDLDAAAATLVLAAEAGLSTKDMPVVAQVAVASAYVTGRSGDAELAARRLGAADRIRGQADLMNGDARTLATELRHDLGDAAYERLFAEGLDLDQDAAIALAFPASTPVR